MEMTFIHWQNAKDMGSAAVLSVCYDGDGMVSDYYIKFVIWPISGYSQNQNTANGIISR